MSQPSIPPRVLAVLAGRLRLAALLVAGPFGLGGSCTADDLAITSPVDGAVVTTSTVAVEVHIDPAAYVPGSLEVTLNGSPLALAGGPDVFTASVPAGAPLRDDCILVARAVAENGVTFTKQAQFQYAPPGKARARRITDPADLMSGPLAHGQVGDWLIENGVARFIVQDAPQRDLYSVGAFGGNLIDAELVGHPGLENFLELQPMLNAETIVNAQSVEIVNDGQDGTPAIVRSCGPDDLLDFLNLSTILSDRGLPVPGYANDTDYEVEACTEWVLEPGRARLRLRTTVFNGQAAALGQLVGDYVGASGELEQWSAPLGIGEQLVAPNFTGLHFEGVGEATGTSYSVVPVPVPGSAIPESSYLATSGVTGVLQSNSLISAIFFQQPPTFTIPAGGSRSFERYFGVGAGSSASGVDLELEVRATTAGTLQGCVTMAGAPIARARVGVGPVSAGKITALVTHFVTDATGCYAGSVPTGSYGVAAGREGSLYSGDAAAPAPVAITISAGATTTVPTIDLPAPARVRVTVTDESDAPVPARISIVGFDPSPEQTIVLPGGLGLPDIVTGVLHDVSKDPRPYGFVRHVYAGADGVADFETEPGSFQLFVTRGGEYSLFEAPVTLTSGATKNVAARIARVVDTAGFVSSDYHVHGVRSSDSRVNDTDRVQQFAGEGVDNVIMTDHHVHTDLTGRIAELGMTPFLRATVGEEITTWDYGHFNAYPLQVVPGRASRGSTDWAGAAPPGRDFPSYGAFALAPAAVAALAETGATSLPDTVIQVNHIGSYFSALQIDTGLVPPQTFISPARRLEFRLDPAGGNLFHHFAALELWNGAGRGDQRQFLVDRIGVWFNHLNQGMRTTFIADTDTHDFFKLGAAGGRTWTASSTDAPAAIDPGEVARSVRAGKAVGGQGVYVQTRLVAADGSGASADLGLSGSTLVASSNGDVDLEIRVQAPTWAEYDRIEIYANAATTVTGTTLGTPTAYGAVPTATLDLGAGFTRSTVNVAPGVPGGERFETTLSVPFHGLSQDTWFVVVAKGRDGVSKPMFPAFPEDLARASNTTLAQLLDGNLGESGTMALGATNALYADVDGAPGFQAPSAPTP
jgi:hypothetical protein